MFRMFGGELIGREQAQDEVRPRTAAGDAIERLVALAALARFHFAVLQLDEFSKPAAHR